MRFFIDGRLDIRPLGSQDKAHTPLPYDSVDLYDSTAGTADEGVLTLTFDEDDWGAGQDFYPSSMTLYFYSATEFFTDNNQGVMVHLYTLAGPSSFTILKATIEAANITVIALATGFAYQVTVDFDTHRVPSTYNLIADISNFSGQTLTITTDIIGVLV